MNPVYSAATAVSVLLFRFARWDLRITGAEHIPRSGPGVIATNHVGYLDFVFVGYGAWAQARRPVRFVAKREVFDHPVSGPLMRAMGHIRVDRDGDTANAMRQVASGLGDGDLLGMFPEGTVSRSFVPLEGRPGAARMAMSAGAPLVPGAVWGSQRIFTKGRRPELSFRSVVTVTFGPPITYAPGESHRAVHGRLMDTIRNLVDDAQRGYPQRPAGPRDAWWQPAHLGGGAPTVQEAETAARVAAEQRRQRRAAERARAHPDRAHPDRAHPDRAHPDRVDPDGA